MTAPRTVRLCVALLSIAVGGILAASATATSGSEASLPTLNHEVLTAVNTFRSLHGLGQLRESRALDRSARVHSLEMGKVGYFAHPSADGTVFWRADPALLRRAQLPVLVGRREPALVVAERHRGRRAEAVDREPRASPEPARREWREIGVSAVHVVRAPGIFGAARDDHHHGLRRPTLAAGPPSKAEAVPRGAGSAARRAPRSRGRAAARG